MKTTSGKRFSGNDPRGGELFDYAPHDVFDQKSTTEETDIQVIRIMLFPIFLCLILKEQRVVGSLTREYLHIVYASVSGALAILPVCPTKHNHYMHEYFVLHCTGY